MKIHYALLPAWLLAASALMCAIPPEPAVTPTTPGSPPATVTPDPGPAAGVTPTIVIPPTGDPIGTLSRELDVVEKGPSADQLEPVQDIPYPLFPRDFLRVHDGGEGVLDFGNDMRLRLFNDTELGITSSAIDPDTPLDISISLEEGGLTGELTAAGGQAVFITPSGAKITVLGTEFCVVYDLASGLTVVCNFDGTVELVWGGGRAGLPAGHYTRIQSGQPPVSAVPLPVSRSEFDKLARELRSPVMAVAQFEKLATPDITPTSTPDVSGPPAPVLISPVDQSQVPCAPVTLAWQAVSDPSGIGVYLVVVDSVAVSGERTPYNTYSIEGNFTQLTESLPCGSSYAWWAQAQDGTGNPGGRSDQEYFAVVAAAGSCSTRSTRTPVVDFNGDGYGDLAVGIPSEDVGDVADAGAVNILYGSAKGLSAAGDQVWHQDSPNIEDGAEARDSFGWAQASGDFDGDGYTDLAVGIPDEDIGNVADAGAVNILYGSVKGLTATGNQLWDQDSPDIEGGVEEFDYYGWALAAGDFDGDGYTDLAVGITDEDIGDVADVGAVNILYGSPRGLSAAGNQIWHQGSPEIEGGPEEDDSFGWALAAGDFDGDSYTDLAVGVPHEAIGDTPGAGAVNILYGSAEGLLAAGDQVWHQDSPDIEGGVEEMDFFGSALAASDFNSDNYTDLAVGVPDEDIVDVADAGAVNIVYGSARGLSAAGNQVWHQDSPDIEDGVEEFDSYGWALAAGDFDGDGYSDLGVGIPYEDIGDVADAGAVNILYGSVDVLTPTRDQLWDQDSPDIEGGAEAEDFFGSALAAGDFDGSGCADLAVGVPDEDLGDIVDAGAVNILYGSEDGLSATGQQRWHQDSLDIEDGAEAYDSFGWALASAVPFKSVVE